MKAKAEAVARAGEQYLGRSYQEMDCQAFVERCLQDAGIEMNLPGSNAWYRKMSWAGSPEECKAKFESVPVGAFLFILEKDGGEPAKYRGDGIGNASHIGIKTGRGDGAIHSSQSRGCVAESVFRDKTIRGGWNRVGLWDELDYGEMVNGILGEKCDGGGVPGCDIGDGSFCPSPEGQYTKRTVPEVPPDAACESDERREEKGSPPDAACENDGRRREMEVPPDAADPKSERGNDTLKAVVHSEDGNAVKLRNSPSRTEKLWWNVPDGTPVTVMERGNLWSRIQAGERVGYMLTSFLKMEEEKITLVLEVPSEAVPALKVIMEEIVNRLKEVNSNDDL